MKYKEVTKPPSLSQLFNAPDDYIGVYGLCCGYSADSEFLDNAMERFTRYTRAQRAYEGKISLQLVLDPAHPQITFIDVPGVYHVPLNAKGEKPFRLMHAKVAILGFQHQKENSKWRVRLIVSTGNWTRQTLEESLDLVWWIEVNSDDLVDNLDTDIEQRCGDISRATDFFKFIGEYYPTVLSENNDELKKLSHWLKLIDKNKGTAQPRFFDNRVSSFLEQIPAMVKSGMSGKIPNYLAMGSGFFEGNPGNDKAPDVLNGIVNSLKKSNCLTSSSEIDVFVNQQACQGVSDAFDAMRKLRWKIRKAHQPSYYGNEVRTLHAKFLFSAYKRSDSLACLNAWVYMGSGNLSKPGFGRRMSYEGNLEAAVLFFPETLYWSESMDVSSDKVVSNVLPINSEGEIEDGSAISFGGAMPDRGMDFVSAPVTSFNWAEDQNGEGWLISECVLPRDLRVINLDGNECSFVVDKGFRWIGKRPRQVEVKWGKSKNMNSAYIVVIDELGRIGATELPELDIEQAWLQLMTFPSPPEDEDIHDGGEYYEDDKTNSYLSSREVSDRSSYTIRMMMELIENIAQKQTALSSNEWPYWCTRLEQTLIQSAGCDVVEKFKELGLNPLSMLQAAPFRPDFSINNPKDNILYKSVIDHVSEKWGVRGLKNIGDDS